MMISNRTKAFASHINKTIFEIMSNIAIALRREQQHILAWLADIM